MSAALCTGCAAPLALNPRRKGSMCRDCAARVWASSFERKTKNSAAMERRWADPKQRRKLSKAISAALTAKMATDPDFANKRRAVARINGLNSVERLNQPAGSAQRILAGQRNSESRLGWCPPQYRDEYRKLRKNGKHRAAAARGIMQARIAANRPIPISTRSRENRLPMLSASAAPFDPRHAHSDYAEAMTQGSRALLMAIYQLQLKCAANG